MKRRESLLTLAAGGFGMAAARGAVPATAMQLHVDLVVAAGSEAGLVRTFREVFSPVIRRQPGFVDVRLMKFRVAKAGAAPKDCTYRLLISFETEPQREAWVASADHQKVWPQMERHLKLANALVFDLV